MNPNCPYENPLRRDGTSQAQRLLKALEPEYVKIDEREFADLLIYARDYSEKLKYWDLTNTDTGLDWRPFFENDTVLAAEIVHLDLRSLRTGFEALMEAFEPAATPVHADLIALFSDPAFGIEPLARRIDDWFIRSSSELGLWSSLQKVIQSQAGPALTKLIAFDLGADNAVPVVPATPTGMPLSGLDYAGFATPWNVTGYAGVTLIDSVYTGTTDADKMRSGASSIESVFDAFLTAIERLKELAAAFIEQMLNDYPNHEPHFGLFVTFLRLFRHAQDHLNTLTGRQLDFYYHDVLNLFEKDAIPAQAHVIFELAKGVDSLRIDAGTRLKAGKDDLSRPVQFETDREIVVNKGKITDLRSLFIGLRDPDDPGSEVRMYSGAVANSLDGNGTELPEENLEWNTFGESRRELDLDLDGETDLLTMQRSRGGFAFASPILWMRQGERTINLRITTSNISNNSAFAALLVQGLSFRITGEEGWVYPDNAASISVTNVSGTRDRINITLVSSPDVPAYAFYDKEVHGGTYETRWPVLEVVFNWSASLADLYGGILAEDVEIYKADINISVKGVTDLIIQNDSGLIDPSKPFTPFTAIPQPGNNFYIGSAEIFSKELTGLDVDVEWMGVPDDNFETYYNAYRKSNGSKIILTKKGNFKARLKLLDDFIWKDLVQIAGTQQAYVFPENYSQTFSSILRDVQIAYQQSQTYSSGTTVSSGVTPLPPGGHQSALSILPYHIGSSFDYSHPYTNRVWLFDSNDARLPIRISVELDASGDPDTNFSHLSPFTGDTVFYPEADFRDYTRDEDLIELDSYRAGMKRGFVKLELDSNFLHSLFPKVQTEAVLIGADRIANNVPTGLVLPNKPYTPVIKDISVDYSSSVSINYENLSPDNFGDRVEQFFHIHPFGEAECFPARLAAQLPHQQLIDTHLFPQFTVADGSGSDVMAEGTLFIGVENFQPPQILSVLFQMAEGTEDAGLDKEPVRWSYLSHNRWLNFTDRQIVSDSTNNFVNSGIVEFDVPFSASQENSLLPAGYVWLKASVAAPTAAISKMLSIQAQAMSATFVNADNDPAYLADPVPSGTINSLVNRNPKLKKITQPYGSFGGKVEEQSSEFYRRISERLRHKNRAITIHDYERIVLEEFPEIYKVKCINHTDRNAELSPGSVSVVLIPRVENFEGSKNPFELKVGSRTLFAVESHLRRLVTPFVYLEVRNPQYERVRVTFDVAFRPGYDPTFYKRQLEDEIKGFISPWAYGQLESIIFGGELQYSLIVNFIEERSYVDYIENFSMSQDGTTVSTAIASAAASILVTDESHDITIIS